MTQGGYSKHVVVREEFVLSVPKNLELSRVAPLLCAGITTYSPLHKWGVKKGSRVAVVGLGGLGHMAVKNAVAMGATVTVIGRTESKKEDAIKLGAQHYLVSNNDDEMKNAQSAFDVIIDTIPVLSGHIINKALKARVHKKLGRVWWNLTASNYI